MASAPERDGFAALSLYVGFQPVIGKAAIRCAAPIPDKSRGRGNTLSIMSAEPGHATCH
jgi:hypothetical protein